MKYKISGIVMAVIMFAVAAMSVPAETEEQQRGRVHQHLTYRQYEECDDDTSQLCSHLPLVIINTNGQEIPGAPTDEEDMFGEKIYATAKDGSSFIQAEISVIDNADSANHLSDTPAFTTLSQFRIRGHSSRRFEKSSYLLKFIDEDGKDNAVSVMGMDAHNEWALHGPYLDRSLVRNYMWYNISGEIMDWAPNVRFCEVILNGDYRGLYLMTETITNGDDCRLNLKMNVKNSEVTGYLLRMDRPTEADISAIRDIYTFTERIGRVNVDMAIRYPGKNRLTGESAKDIELDFAAFEKALYSYDHDNEDYGYWNWIEEDSFVDYFIINEITRNVDAGSYSTYIYKEVNGKYKMCVWDFNNACDNYQEEEKAPQGFKMPNSPFYFMLFKDEEFAEHVIERYRQLRKSYLSDEYLMNYIDETLAYLGPAIDRNNAKWDEIITQWAPLEPETRNVHSHEEAVAQLKSWLLERSQWMDNNIDALRAVAHPSRNKKYDH